MLVVTNLFSIIIGLAGIIASLTFMNLGFAQAPNAVAKTVQIVSLFVLGFLLVLGAMPSDAIINRSISVLRFVAAIVTIVSTIYVHKKYVVDSTDNDE